LEGEDRAKPTIEINGKKAAQIMLCMGSQTGTVTGHSKWRENLRLAMQYHQTIEALYPGLARPLLLRSSKYNQHLTTGSILLEIGTESNTLSEAEYSASLAAEALINLLNTLV
jgi:stage II sporulation protein P